tara:strand:- start:38 stop:220 length:183 start_codon:yes stop_codon:yes gene_type:complete
MNFSFKKSAFFYFQIITELTNRIFTFSQKILNFKGIISYKVALPLDYTIKINWEVSHFED